MAWSKLESRLKVMVAIAVVFSGLCASGLSGMRESLAQGETSDSLQFPPGSQTHRQGPYFGEEPPGLSPKIFAPGIISTAGHYEMDLSFTRDGRECYIGRDGNMLVSRWEKEGWTSPEPAPFRFQEYGAMVLTTVDGNRMILSGRNGLAVSHREGNGWSDPVLFAKGMGMSITNDGTVYTSWIHEPSGEWRLYRSRYVEGTYREAEEVPLSIYSSRPARSGMGMAATHPQIAPDESYVVFESRRPGGYGDTDYYVSFQNSDGTWSDPVNLGPEINCSKQNARARVSPDGRYLFFNRYGDMYWVKSDYVEKFRRAER